MGLHQHPTEKHEKLAQRLGDILTLLNQGKILTVTELARHFGTSERTIYRDLNERFAYLPLIKDENGYRLEERYLGRLDFQDLRDFAAMAGVLGMFPNLDTGFVRELLDTKVNMVYAIKGIAMENTADYAQLFDLLKKAITQRYAVRFSYKKTCKEVFPYKLVHHHGSWYLAGLEDEQIRTYRISLMVSAVINYDEPFEHDAKLMQQIEDEDSIWMGRDKKKVIIQLNEVAAPYFKARKLLPQQELIQELDGGGLLLSCMVVDLSQILPIVRYWIPHAKIVHPEHLQLQLEQQVLLYVNNGHIEQKTHTGHVHAEQKTNSGHIKKNEYAEQNA